MRVVAKKTDASNWCAWIGARRKHRINHLEKRILRLHKGGAGILKIGKTLGIGTGTVQRVVMEQPRPFEASASV